MPIFSLSSKLKLSIGIWCACNSCLPFSRLALNSFKRCDKLLGGRCVPVLYRLSMMYDHVGLKGKAEACMDRAAAINSGVLKAIIDEHEVPDGEEGSD